MMNIQLGNQIFNQKESPKRKIWWILVVSVLVDAETKSDLLKDHWPQQTKSSAPLTVRWRFLANRWCFLGIPNAKSTNRVVLRSSVYGILAAVWNQTDQLIPELAKWGYSILDKDAPPLPPHSYSSSSSASSSYYYYYYCCCYYYYYYYCYYYYYYYYYPCLVLSWSFPLVGISQSLFKFNCS